MMKINKIQNTNLNLKVRAVRLVAMTALRKKCGLESSMVIQKAVSTMTPLTLLRVLPGGNT
ncbi:MAG: hypothetical protein ACLSIF_00015 [Faecalimonas umbilicata]